MAAASSSLSEDQFLCSICLDVFTDPVSTPCGHNFCKNCITTHWNIDVTYQCPNCNKGFDTRPELQVNTFVSEMVSHFRQSAQQRASSSEQQAAEPGDVPCDVCTGPKVKALKSCLVCLVSYCETHLEPHLTALGLKRHQLIDPVKNLEGRMCRKHKKPLELFCKPDQRCVCMLCSVLNHKSHDVVPLKEQYERNLAKLGKTRATIEQMIKMRQLKIQEFKDSVSISRAIADREIAIRNHVFAKLKEAIERHQAKLIKTAEEKHRMTEQQAEGFIKEMEQEISELKKRSSELEQLLFLEDHLNLVQNFSSLDAAPPTKNWTEVRVYSPSYEGTVGTTVDQLVKMVKKQVKKFLKESELKTVQQYAVDVTLDPDTAHPRLILSEDGKQVRDGTVWKDLRHNPERFSHSLCVLGKQFVSSGRFYFEVQVKGKPDWGLGVAAESVNRKGLLSVSPKNGYWTMHSRKGNFYHSFTETFVPLFLTLKPEKVGVFVDYDEGLVSFYDVNAAALIDAHIGCSFTEKLHPVFLLCANQGGKTSAPLIICPVHPT